MLLISVGVLLPGLRVLGTTASFTQQLVLRGKVTDQSGTPLSGVNVAIKGTVQGTTTGEAGAYEIIVDQGNVLVFTYVGFVAKELTVGSDHLTEVILEPDVAQLDEAVVIGYGTQDKRALTSAVTNINNKAFKDMKVSSFEQLLTGQAAGVQVVQTTGHPGAGLQMRVRGTGSINALNEPLYVVDGMPIEPSSYNSRANSLSFLNPSNIESITILKDAASTSIYGSRGSNGVVLITTKSGKAGATTFQVNAYYGVQQIPKRGRIDVMNAEEFADFRIETLEDAAKIRGEVLDPSLIPEGYRNVSGAGTNWFDFVTTNYAPMQQYDLTMSTGSERSKTMVAAEYYNVEGILSGSDFQRASFRVNNDIQINDAIRFGARVNPSYSFRNLGGALEGTPNEGPLIGLAYAASPIVSPYAPDGSPTPVIASAPENWNFANPVNRFAGIVEKQKDFRILASAFLEIDLFEDLKFKTNLGTDINFSEYRYWYPWWIGTISSSPGGNMLLSPELSTARANRTQLTSWLMDNYLTYRKTIADSHNLELLLGHTVQRQEYDLVSAEATRFADDRVPYVSAGLQGDFRTGSSGSDASRYALLSYFARANYSFNNRYYVNATIRRDGSSRFSSQARFGNFPSVSLGWRISDESFMEGFAFIDDMKIRASYGLTGNNNVGSSFAYVSPLIQSNYILGGHLASGQHIAYVDQGLRWERNKETDVGIDLVMLNSRITFTADYYRRLTVDMLLNRPVPSITSAESLLSNIGKLENKGVELGISTKNITRQDLEWETSANVTFNRNKVVALNHNNDPIEAGNVWWGGTITQVGKPIGLYKGYVIDGIYMNEAEALADRIHNPGAQAGTLRVIDTNNDGQISSADRAVIGNPHPDFIFGFRSSLRYKNADLSVIASGSVGNDVFLSYYESVRNIDGVFNVLKDVKDRWRSPEQPGKGIYPTTNYADQRQYTRLGSNMWVADGSYLRIDNITLGINLQERLLNKTKYVKGARLYLSVQNAFIFSKTDLNNPDASLNGNVLMIGWQKQNYPVARVFTFGTNINF